MFKSVVGHSEDIDTPDAVAEVIESCKQELGDAPASAAFVFAYVGHDLALVAKTIAEAFPNMPFIGATTDGELSSKCVHSDASMVLHILSDDEVEFVTAVAREASADPSGRAEDAANEASKALTKKAALCIAFPESLTLSGDSAVAGLRRALGDDFPVFGGTSGDNRRVKKTYQLCNGEVLSDSVPLMLISEPIAFSHARLSGWEPLDAAGVVTKSEGNVVFEIDDKPAVDFFSKYVGRLVEAPGTYSEYPLLVDGADGTRQVAAINVDLEKNAVVFFGDVPQGARVRLAEADRDMIVAATGDSVNEAIAGFPGVLVTALAFSCAARKGILGTRTREEGETMKSLLPETPFSGFYCYGEIAPEKPGAASTFNNEMFVTLLLGRK